MSVAVMLQRAFLRNQGAKRCVGEFQQADGTDADPELSQQRVRGFTVAMGTDDVPAFSEMGRGAGIGNQRQIDAEPIPVEQPEQAGQRTARQARALPKYPAFEVAAVAVVPFAIAGLKRTIAWGIGLLERGTFPETKSRRSSARV